MGKPIVTLRNASVRVGDRLLFRNTHWTLRRGEQWALLGPNGAGKTLFASALAGAVPIVRGDFHTDGLIEHVSFEQQKALAGDAPPAARWFSLEEEQATTVSHFLSQDNIEERNPFEVVTRSTDAVRAFRRRRNHVVNLLGIESLLEQPLPSLSNGEMRKTLLARALLRKPRLLILDDPFAGLDTRSRRHLKAILERLIQRRSVSLLLIASHADELPRGLTHMLRVDHCRVLWQGPFTRRRARESFRVPSDLPNPSRLPARNNSAKPEELIRLDNVTVRYGERVILKNIHWVVRRGEHWALLGPNGSGKSTLLSLIIGDNPQAYANDVRVFGQQRGGGESVWKLKQRIGVVSPELHLHFPPEQTCLETVASGFTDTHGCHRPPTARQRAAARRWLAQLGLTTYAEKPFGTLSAGTQRMALLARALVKSPDLLVLDEPCQGLDAAHRARFLRLITALRRHTTIIYVTHRYDEIPSGIERVFRLKRSGSRSSK